ncbi:type IV pilus secretin PilQ [Ottowia sp.]|uniref:type IV pilus secretin PilQ n=1 Tax=Ottowia sp. TaxID=1898956 RepID=UPI002BEFC83D|nr:type IV pilus secretin PilQ [Ottowia sp.]HRN74547.1 type IV pilus secretin PilQ [Ottowia sp.]HRQ01997.1 type IV pilus secretin PilQ [Ottowia sp.]
MRNWFGNGRVAWRAVVVALLAQGLASAVWAQARIESLSGSVQGGAEMVRIELSEPLTAVPTGFMVQSPARIALDFPGVSSGLAKPVVELNQGNLLGANVVQASDRTRVVLNLKQATGYRAELQGRSLLVTLEPVAVATQVPSALAPAPADSRAGGALPLKDIDFRRGVENTGRVIVDLASNQTGVDIRQQGQNLVVEFLGTSLPEGLRRRLDVSDFGTPVQTITTVQSGDRVRMVIEPRGPWEHSAYQSDNQLVVEVRQQRSNPDKLTKGPGYSGEKLSLNFQNIDVRSLLQVIADFTNFNIVTSDSVQGSLTLRLKDVPWDQALDIILHAKDLGMKRVGNVLQIAPKEEIAAKEKAELEAQAAIRDLEAVRTQSFQLSYAKAPEIAAQLTGESIGGAQGMGMGRSGDRTRLLSARGSVIAEPRTNQLFVSDIPSRLAQVQEMIAKLDVPVRQVLIEARIVEATDTFGKSLGVKLGGADLRGVRGGDAGYRVGGNNRVAFGGTYDAITRTTREGPYPYLDETRINNHDLLSSQIINLPALALKGAAPANFAISLFNSAANRFLNLEISALEADGKGRVVSSPRVVTADQTKALIEQGTEFAYQQATSSGATAVAFRKAVLKLEVTPQITPEGNIILDLDVNKDSPGGLVAGAMSINTKRVRTQVLVENGGTVVIGGIFELTETESENKVPLLGDIPVVGNLFKQRTRQADKQEMLVFITPKTISDYGSVR